MRKKKDVKIKKMKEELVIKKKDLPRNKKTSSEILYEMRYQ